MKRLVQVAATIVLSLGTNNPLAIAQPINDAIAKITKVPRYYSISATGSMKDQEGFKFCLGGEAFNKLIERFLNVSKDSQARGNSNKGCISTTVRTKSSASIQNDCDEKKGAPFSSHLHIFGTANDWHIHSEIILQGFGPDGGYGPIISDVSMIYVGQCPANVKHGQVLKPDGAVLDPFRELQRLSKVPPNAAVAIPK